MCIARIQSLGQHTGMNFLYGFLLVVLPLCKVVASTPSWVNNIGDCPTSEICVVGSGVTLKDAVSQGRSEVAKFFETKVKVDSRLESSSVQTGLNISEAKYEEWSSKVVSEEADELLSGIEIKKSIQENDTYFVLLSLAKSQAEKTLREKIEKIDRENEALIARDSRFLYPLVMLNLKKRNYYLSRYLVISNTPIKSVVTEEKMIQLIGKLKSLKMSLISANQKLSPSLKHLLEKIFSPLRVVFVPKNSNPKFNLKTNLNFEEAYFKVTGFKKLNSILNLELLNDKEKTLGRLSASSVQIARSKEQALEKSLEDFENQISENLDQLALDKTGDVE